MPFQPGQSGNPKGRPKKTRALTEILERAGGKTVKDPSGLSVTGRRFLALRLWELATTGRATLVDGVEVKAEGDAWFDVVKFLYTQIDGPPKHEVDVTSGGKPLTIREVVIEREKPPVEDGAET